MAPLSNHVSLTITQDSVGIARAGFGVPLILSHNAGFAERLRTYNDLAGVLVDFAADSPEALSASAIFAQAPHPEEIAIGRAALVPTQNYFISVATVRDLHTYTIKVKGEGVTATDVTFTSDATATANEIALGLEAALNTVVGKNFTAVVTVDDIDVTGDAAGDWFSLEVDPADLRIEQDHVDPGVATDLAAISLENDDWYCLYTLYNSNALVLGAALYIETVKKIYVADVNETDALNIAVGGATDTLDDLATLNYARTMAGYHPAPAAFFSAAWMGRVLPADPGSITWKFKTLSGVAAVSMTSTQRGNVTDKSGNSYEVVSGRNITFEGTTADGDFMDVQRGLDWLEDDMSKGVFGALAGTDKVPFTDPGVAIIEAEVRASLRRATNNGILAEDPEFTVTVPLVADVSAPDKAARTLPDVKFSGTLAGAIHKVVITGVVSA